MKGGRVFVGLLVFLLQFVSLKSENPGPSVSAIYSFGDSLSDSGNNNLLNIDPKQAKANYKPYGVDLPNGPTGRFTNGKTFVDVVAEKLRLPHAPAFLSLGKEEREKIVTGLNYASGSAGILIETGSAFGECVPFDRQIDHFQRTVEEVLPVNFHSKQELQCHLAKSVIVVAIGSNDLLNNWIQNEPEYHRSKNYPLIKDYIKLLIDTLQGQIQRIYNLGGRRFLMFGLGPLGCIPIVTHRGAPCKESWNQLALEFNNQLAQLVDRFQSKLEGSSFALGLGYNLTLDLHLNPSRYGFKSVNQPCCTVSSSEPALCIPGTEPCRNRDDHLYYDMFHCTSKAAEIIVSRCFDAGSSICAPTAILKLTNKEEEKCRHL
ncbi:GDSL esterase/lipase 7-like [Aristolochia californica]|uniref:GDSL esterase/lipase 7-like n=1 Tax=Aristolochia californica TaxID=171875 RepID=UPI0035D78B55